MGATTCNVVHAATKMIMPGTGEDVLLAVHYATLLDDDNEDKSLLTLMDMSRHGAEIESLFQKSTNREYQRDVEYQLDNTFYPSNTTRKSYPSTLRNHAEDIKRLDKIELNGIEDKVILGNDSSHTRQKHKRDHWNSIPMMEWQR